MNQENKELEVQVVKVATKKKKNRQAGFTLLEYCAGAAVMIGVVYVALNTLGQDLNTLLGSLSTWATNRNNVIQGSAL